MQILGYFISVFGINLRIEQKQEQELLSLRDTRIIVIANIFADQETVDKLYEQMKIRHKNRKCDIDRFYKMENDGFKV